VKTGTETLFRPKIQLNFGLDNTKEVFYIQRYLAGSFNINVGTGTKFSHIRLPETCQPDSAFTCLMQVALAM
jgi:hypothetical protein